MTALPRDPLASILVVDDRPSNLLALEALLAPLEQRLIRAQSGAEALVRAEAEELALVLMDVNMPKLDGFETVAQLRRLKNGRDVPVIFVTAIHDAREHMARGYQHGAVDYVSKPFDPEFLVAKVSWFVSLWQRGVLIKRQERLIQEREREAAREQALREAAEAATRAKDEFLAMVSHDLLTPLTAIIGWAEMIKKGMLDPPHVEKAVDTILHCAGAQRDLIEDLLDISRVIAGKLDVRPAPIDLRDVVERVVETLAPSARAGGIEIAVVRGSPAPVLGDAERLEQLIGNLLQNAIKFSKRGGHVELSLREDSDGNLILRVRDWGAGIPAELLPHVFERYKQGADGRARGGLGLGLAIARHIAELHGGVIEAASAGEGQGATFTLKLPIRQAAVSNM